MHAEASEVLKAGLKHARWIQVDDTGACHIGQSGYGTMVANDFFAHFRSTKSKSRPNVLEQLCADDIAYHINDAAFAYMARHGVVQKTNDRLRGHSQKHFDSKEQWLAYLEALDITSAEAIKRNSEAVLWDHIADIAVRSATMPVNSVSVAITPCAGRMRNETFTRSVSPWKSSRR